MHNPIYFTWTILLDIQYSEHTTDNKNLQLLWKLHGGSEKSCSKLRTFYKHFIKQQ